MKELDRILARYHLESVMLSGEVGGRQLEARIIRPTDGSWTGAVMRNGWHRRGNFDEHRLALELVSLSHLSKLRRRRTVRHMPVESVAEELRAFGQGAIPGDRALDEVVSMMGSISEPATSIYDQLRYRFGTIELPIDQEAYIDYRDAILEGTAQIRRAIHNSVPNKQAAEQVFFVAHRRIALVSLKRERAKKGLEPLAEQALQILEHAAQRTGAVLSCFDWDKTDRLLSEVIEVCSSRSFRRLRPPEPEKLLRPGRSHAKIEALHYIHESLRDRSEYFEAVLREVDAAECYVLGQASRQLYREIRGLLTRAERRLFAFMFLQRVPLPGAGGLASPLFDSVFWFDPLLRDLAKDERIVALVVAVIGFPRESPGQHLTAELERRVKALLEYKRIWLTSVRDRERRARAERRLRARRNDHIDVEQLQDPRGPSRDPYKSPANWSSLQADEASRTGIADLLERYGLLEEAGRLFWREGLKQKEIASNMGITQQAVSARLRRRWNRLCEVLERDGKLSTGVRLRKGRWVPR